MQYIDEAQRQCPPEGEKAQSESMVRCSLELLDAVLLEWIACGVKDPTNVGGSATDRMRCHLRIARFVRDDKGNFSESELRLGATGAFGGVLQALVFGFEFGEKFFQEFGEACGILFVCDLLAEFAPAFAVLS